MPPLTLDQRIHKALELAVEFDGFCFRNVSQRFANRWDILSPEGSRITGGRYNFKGSFGVLYLACDLHTCLEETTQANKALGFDIARRLPRTIVGIKVKLSKVLDLTDKKTRRTIGVSKSVLTETDWRHIQNVRNQEAITQQIGRFAKESGFEAILVPSAQTKGKNLNVFPDNLLPSSRIEVVNEDELR